MQELISDIVPGDRVVDVADLLSERDENAVRKDFTPTEAVAIGRLIEEHHRAKIAAQKSQQMRQNISRRLDRLPTSGTEQIVTPLGCTRVVVSRAVGMDQASYFRAKKVVLAAEADAEKFGDLPALMDETGNILGTYKEMKRRQGAPERHPMNRRRHRTDAARVAQSAISTIEGALLAFEGLDISNLVGTEAQKYGPQLSRLAAELRAVARRFK